ncbi:MAG: site-specific integrase [Muribaculaceae bacterium]|nr:site-specific integrase [Muribaculaceae bacterium]
MTEIESFREISSLWKEEKRKYVKLSTISAYAIILENHLLPTFGDKTKVIEENDVQEFVFDKLNAGLSQKTVKDFMIVLKMLYRFGVKIGVMEHRDWDIKYPVSQERNGIEVLNITNQRKLLSFLTENFTFRNLGIMLCLHTGMRIGEVCALQWEDIDITQGIINVRRTIERIYIIENDEKRTELIISTPKTQNSIREIPLSKELIKVIKPLKKVVNDTFFVLTNESKPTEPRTYRNYYKSVLQNLKIPLLKFHGLRHSFATRCIESQCDYKTVSVILGHANISTTLNLYVHPNLEQKKRCIDKMTKLLK